MAERRREPRGLVTAATSCAAVVLAGQLAGKAARDAIFLHSFSVTYLPVVLAISSALAIGATFLVARSMTRRAPVQLVRVINGASACLLAIEWLLLDRLPRPLAVVVYMHQALLGPILVSGFWSVVSECFDPRAARRFVGTIGTGATLGGLAGAVIAERVAAMLGTAALLPTIAVLQLIAVWRLGVIGRGCVLDGRPEQPAVRDVVHNIARVSMLRRLAIITVIVTVSAALLDYLFKAVVAADVRHPDDLARLFALFHGVVGISTAVVQWTLGRRALQRWGLARTLATLPGAVIVFGAAALAAPGLGSFVALRGAENVLRNSLYRDAYEVFYTPLLVHERRATKTVIDVGVERLGDVLGGLLVLALLAMTQPATTLLLVCAVGLSALGVLVALEAQHSYVQALERSLTASAIELDRDDPMSDRTTRATIELIAQRRRGGGPGPLFPAVARRRSWIGRELVSHAPPDGERRLADLHSDDPTRIRAALRSPPLSSAAVAHAIPLLARDELARDAAAAIAEVAASYTGQLLDALRDPRAPLAARRRLPRLIAQAPSDLARVGLTWCLTDPELEVRAAVAGALAELRERSPAVELDRATIFDAVRRELVPGSTVARALAEARPGCDDDPPRAAQHLATLLALALPADPIRSAFHNLWSGDHALRGVALEYLENVLPGDLRDRLWRAFGLEAPRPGARKRPIEDVLAELRSRCARSDEPRTTQLELPPTEAIAALE